jgi:murein DD-endopeptidase MepM/ murein hydrolase activator NlpD
VNEVVAQLPALITDNNSPFGRPVEMPSSTMYGADAANAYFNHDYGVFAGTSVYAVADGIANYKISTIMNNGEEVYYSYGMSIELVFSDRKGSAKYAHLSAFVGGPAVQERGSWKVGVTGHPGGSTRTIGSKSVTRGELIAISGETGYAKGAHLHFELYLDGARVEPKNYIP